MPRIAQIVTINCKPFVELEWPPESDQGSVSIYTDDEVEVVRRHAREAENWECAQIAERYGEPQIRDDILRRRKM